MWFLFALVTPFGGEDRAADQGALEASANNVANANTPGYSREVPILEASDPVVVPPLTFGSGVTLLLVGALMILGGGCMLGLRAYGLAVTSAILTAIVCRTSCR